MAQTPKVRLEMTEEEAAKVLHYLGDCCTDEVLAEVYYRLQDLLKRREPKRFNIHKRNRYHALLPAERLGDRSLGSGRPARENGE